MVVCVFLFLWLMAGFSTGTSTLVGPVRWVTTLLRSSETGPEVEKWIVRAIILLYVLGSAVIAVWLTRVSLRTSHRHLRFGIPALALLAAASAFWLWMTVGMMDAAFSQETTAGRRFTFGPYPSEKRLRELKDEGYTGVIALLHRAVPFEGRLLFDVQTVADDVGLEFIHVPLLPWVSENTESLNIVRELLKADSGRYYVHCYLGMDRVRLVKSLVEQTEPSTRTEIVRAGKSLSGIDALERGDIYRLDEQIYLTPLPTRGEFRRYVVAGGVSQVVSLLDPEDPEDIRWIKEERVLLSGHGVPLRMMPLGTQPYDPFKVLEAARNVRKLPRPLVVHAYLSPSTGRSPTAEAFLQAFRTNLPPLPPSLFRRVAEGSVQVIAPHVAVGPGPERPEFLNELYDRGVRGFVFLGDPDSPEAQQARELAESAQSGSEANFTWQAVNAVDSGFLRELAEGGPWYLYGPRAASSKQQITERFGVPVPDRVIWSPPLLTSFIQRALPHPSAIILLGPILLLAAAAAGSFVGWLRVKRQMRTPYTRKVFHFSIFTLAAILHLLGGLSTVVLFGSIVSLVVLYAVYRGEGFPLYEAMARPTDAPHRTLFILIPLMTTALGGVVANLLFGRLAYVGYLVGGWGDAVGEPVGTAWGKHRYSVPSLAGVPATRSLEGSAGVLLVGTTAAFAALLAGGFAPLTALKVGALCGVAGAAVETISNHGLDNFTIQVVAAGMAYWTLA